MQYFCHLRKEETIDILSFISILNHHLHDHEKETRLVRYMKMVALAIRILRALAFLAIVASIYGAQMQNENLGEETDRVVGLPGQPSINIQHYAGYVSISKDKSLFYWFFEATEAPKTKPVVLWLNGGPGCSSIAEGALKEIGPFLLNNDEANLIFLESPVGVGFSYSNSSIDFDNLNDQSTAEDSYAFLLGWFDKFPQYKSHKFYMAGESYAGHYIPQLAELIHRRNDMLEKSNYINLQGILMVNPSLEDHVSDIMSVEFAWNHGMIPYKYYKAFNDEYKSLLDQFDEAKYQKCLDTMFSDGFFNDIDPYDIYMPTCSKPVSSEREIGNGFIKEPTGYDPCFFSDLESTSVPAIYLGRVDVQKALHANVTSLPYPYSICSPLVTYKYNKDEVRTIIPSVQKLLNAGYRVWVVSSGDADYAIPFESTRYIIMKMNLTEKTMNKWGGWRAWYYKDQVTGWMVEYIEGLTFLSVRGAGHMVPLFAPAASLSIFSHFLNVETTATVPDAVETSTTEPETAITEYISSGPQVADFFTKTLDGRSFEQDQSIKSSQSRHEVVTSSIKAQSSNPFIQATSAPEKGVSSSNLEEKAVRTSNPMSNEEALLLLLVVFQCKSSLAIVLQIIFQERVEGCSSTAKFFLFFAVNKLVFAANAIVVIYSLLVMCASIREILHGTTLLPEPM
ncbi:serine carboxypeptidase-like 35 [Canna indica]|uniref:Carboxypeptidase n=1 Tax=Canna indica TaxID=4628 RepID=A0AAQ3KFP3_9LILI|nr:serine carboxypeptidase-like 35 [Canna indica]